MTATEKIVADLCEKSFLSFWSFPSPVGKKDKELCDLLVVCDPYIIIFSVKEINIKPSGNFETDMSRWESRAIDGSADQIYGAERIIQLKDEISIKNSIKTIKLPPKANRKIYRVAVAFGRGNQYPLKYGDLGKGYIHAFDEQSIKIVLKELDTITDFLDFLNAKESYIRSGVTQMAYSGEDYLALHFQYGFENLPSGHDLVTLADDLWTSYQASGEYKKEWKANEQSYFWDAIIQTLYKSIENENNSEQSHDLEQALRHMVKEDRFGRRQLSQMFTELLDTSPANAKRNSRIVKLEDNSLISYVYLTRPIMDRHERVDELELRCLVARAVYPENTIVIGLAMEKGSTMDNLTIDLCYHHIPNLTSDFIQKVKLIQNEFGYFINSQQSRLKPDGSWR